MFALFGFQLLRFPQSYRYIAIILIELKLLKY